MDHSPLKRLPVELRINIYEYTLADPISVHIRVDHAALKNGHWASDVSALTHTCKQIRHESLPILLAQNHFIVTVYSDSDKDYRKLADAVNSLISDWTAHKDTQTSLSERIEFRIDWNAVRGWSVFPDNVSKVASLCWLVKMLLRRHNLRAVLKLQTQLYKHPIGEQFKQYCDLNASDSKQLMESFHESILPCRSALKKERLWGVLMNGDSGHQSQYKKRAMLDLRNYILCMGEWRWGHLVPASPSHTNHLGTTSKTHGMDSSPLIYTLPAELRIRIYELAMIQPDGVYCQLASGDLVLPAIPKGCNIRALLPLTTTCKQIRHETLPILFAENQFTIILYPDLDGEDNASLLGVLGKLLTTLTLFSKDRSALSKRLEIQFGWIELNNEAPPMFNLIKPVRQLVWKHRLRPALKLQCKIFAHPICEQVEHLMDLNCDRSDMWERMRIRPCRVALGELEKAGIVDVWTGRLGQICKHRMHAINDILHLVEKDVDWSWPTGTEWSAHVPVSPICKPVLAH